MTPTLWLWCALSTAQTVALTWLGAWLWPPGVLLADPGTIAIATIAIQAVGLVMQAQSQYEAQDAANRQAKAQAESARIQDEAARAREQAVYDQQLEQQRLDREAGVREAEAIELNAQFARENAEAARAAAGIESAQRAEALRRARSRQTAAWGRTGVVLGQGTPLLVEMDALLESSKELAGLELAGQTRTAAFEQEEAIQRISASNVRLRRGADPRLLPPMSRGTSLITTNPLLPAGATLLTGAGNIFSRERFFRAGGTPSSLSFGERTFDPGGIF